MTDSHPVAGRRLHRLALLLALPAVVAAIAMSVVETWRTLRPASPLFVPPFTYTLAEAISAGDLWQAHRFIREGHDPDALMPIADPALTGGQSVFVSPLVWAAARGQQDVVAMLLAAGARPDAPVNRPAPCVARALRHDAVQDLLARSAAARCTTPPPAEGPLLLALAARQ